jgi:hypothetical protein
MVYHQQPNGDTRATKKKKKKKKKNHNFEPLV